MVGSIRNSLWLHRNSCRETPRNLVDGLFWFSNTSAAVESKPGYLYNTNHHLRRARLVRPSKPMNYPKRWIIHFGQQPSHHDSGVECCTGRISLRTISKLNTMEAPGKTCLSENQLERFSAWSNKTPHFFANRNTSKVGQKSGIEK